jgi:hypothetical protein
LHRVVKASQKKVAKAYYEKKAANEDRWTKLMYECPSCETQFTESKKPMSTCPVCRAPADKIKSIKEASQKKAEFPGGPCAGCGKELPTVWGETYCKECSDKKDSPEHKEADLEKDSAQNADVIRMFLEDSFPKDKMPVWGTPNLKITKYPNGWALVNYQTPILYRANGSDVVVFNTHKYSSTTSKIQNTIRSMFAGQSVKDTDEAGIFSVIDQSNLAVPEPEFTPELKQLHESALKLKADLEQETFWDERSYDEKYPMMAKYPEIVDKIVNAIKENGDNWYKVEQKMFNDSPFYMMNLSHEVGSREGSQLIDEVYKWLAENEKQEDKVWTPRTYASIKAELTMKAADPLLGPNGEPLLAKEEVPTTFKKHLKAPPATDRQKAIPATQEQAQLVKDVESSLSNLEAIKSMVTQAKAKLNEEIRAIEEKGGRVSIESELKEKIDRLSKLVEATQNQMVYAGDTMVRLIQETKDRPFKPSDAWKVEKLTERLSKYEDAAKYLDQAVKGAQSLATTEDIRELYFFPAKTSKLSKKANFLDTLDEVYNNVLEALKLVIGNAQKEEPLAE